MERSPVLLSLIDDARLYDKLQQLLGERFVFCGSEGNHGVAGSPTAHHWHADRPGAAELGYLRIKVMLYLVPMTQDNGALRVIPGSHRAPLHQALLPFNQRHVEKDPIFFGEHGSNIPAHVIDTDPGDAVLFSQTLFPFRILQDTTGSPVHRAEVCELAEQLCPVRELAALGFRSL